MRTKKNPEAEKPPHVVRVQEIKLLPTAAQRAALLATMRAVNAAKTFVADRAPRARAFAAHKVCYHEIRVQFGLGAQLAVNAIGDAAATRRHADRAFRPLGSIAYDSRCATMKRSNHVDAAAIADGVSLLTLDGRTTLAIAPGSWRPARVEECRLIFRDGLFFLGVSIATPLPPVAAVTDFLGIDLGLVNIAVDSDGQTHHGTAASGAHLDNVRHRYRRRRQALQTCGSRAARRRLRNIRRKESRFARDVNHTIAKHLVAKAKGTARGIALEDLAGIRARTTVRRSQRARMCSWSFFQLRTFVTYKAALVGVPVVLVDPRYTSQTCTGCGHIDKKNRRTRDSFCCVNCGLAGPADHLAAENIRRAAVNRPIVAEQVGHCLVHPSAASLAL